MTKTCLTCEYADPSWSICCNPRSDHIGSELYSDDSCESWTIAENLRRKEEHGIHDGEGGQHE